jgi:hypothetical protein
MSENYTIAIRRVRRAPSCSTFECCSSVRLKVISPLALNHFENLPVLGHLYPIGVLGELDQGLIAVKIWLCEAAPCAFGQCRKRPRPDYSGTGRTSGACDV